MIEQIFTLAISNGLWAVLFVLLFMYEIKDSRKRETKYQKTVDDLTARLEIVKEIDDNCADIKESIIDIRRLL